MLESDAASMGRGYRRDSSRALSTSVKAVIALFSEKCPVRICVGHVVARVQIRLLSLEYLDVIKLPFRGLISRIEGIALVGRRSILTSDFIRFRARCRNVFDAGIGTYRIRVRYGSLRSLLGDLLGRGDAACAAIISSNAKSEKSTGIK